MIIQIIGKPCSGKSTFIKKYIQSYPSFIWLDVAAWNTSYDKWLFAESMILNKKYLPEENYLIESIGGFTYLQSLPDFTSITIMFECDESSRVHRAATRRSELWSNNDLYYHDILISQSIRPDHIINTSSNGTFDHIKEVFNSIIYEHQSVYS